MESVTPRQATRKTSPVETRVPTLLHWTIVQPSGNRQGYVDSVRTFCLRGVALSEAETNIISLQLLQMKYTIDLDNTEQAVSGIPAADIK